VNKKALTYIRVSSSQQADKDYDPEGFSIPAQREGCRRKADSLDAVVAEEFVDRGESAKTAKRPGLQAMLLRLSEGDIDYVIVHKIDRLARNRADDVAIVMHIRQAGAQLVSVSENIDETPSGLLLHGIMSSIAEFYSRNLATEIIKGSTQKAKKGGTPFRAPLGYLNTREIVEDREIRVVTLDPERAKLIRLAFTLYATGQYALSELAAILEERGLRSRKTRRCPAQPLGTNRLSALLRNDYYVGVVHYNGKTYRGRHEPLVSPEVFGLVQEVLASQRQSGERCWRNHSYLRGTLYCRECKGRLFFVRVRGNGGEYDYFVCSGRQKGTCKQGWHRVEQVEAEIERYYAKIQLTDRQRERVARRVRADLDKLTGVANIEIARAQRTISRLEGEEDKLLERYYAERVSQRAYDRQHERITRERVAAHKMIEKLTIDRDRLLRALNIALSMTKDIQAAYRQADPTQRRFFNQAFFERLEVDAIEIVGHTLSDPYAQLLAHDLIEDAFEEPTPTIKPAETTTPDLPDDAWEAAPIDRETEAEEPAREPDGRILAGVGAGPQAAGNAKTGDLSKVAGYHVASMVELAGLEPATFWLPARRSPN
jgi:site-specific DNA recombinase